ncbi:MULTISPECIES: hypothetical protein [Volucribacter]|uniref:Uncharacterized protein n=2 Tax=Volucribacter TaxID=256730 RepID=A0A4R1G5D7_9PAST|nr:MULTISPECIES: hypothetical protein [Volucribacter]MDG6894131.1 hypothetical protein [Volucribacter amazonae]TCK01680.1 hypothetical protein EV694_0301 [Volucribacter psittacicida]
MNQDRLLALLDRIAFEQQCLRNQIIAIAGKPETIQDDILKHQITVALWHSGEVKGLINLAKKVVEYGE